MNPNSTEKTITVALTWDESDRAKRLHDLHAAANAFKALIELDEAKIPHLDERQTRKYAQLRAHALRLESLVQWVDGIIDQKQDQV